MSVECGGDATGRHEMGCDGVAVIKAVMTDCAPERCPGHPLSEACRRGVLKDFSPEDLADLTWVALHDHAERCCREHDTHSMPHKGCILR